MYYYKLNPELIIIIRNEICITDILETRPEIDTRYYPIQPDNFKL